MQLAVTRPLRRFARTRILNAWALVGFGAGLAAGFVLGELFGQGGSHTIDRMVKRVRSAGVSAPGARAARRHRVLEALAREPGLQGTAFEVIPAGRGALELHGWIATRALRASALRLAQAAADGDTVVDCLLVRGEDDGRPEEPA